MSKEDKERLWNLVMYKMYATDEEIDDVAPTILAVVAIMALLGLGYLLLGGS